MGLRDSMNSSATLVEKFIGTAYDTVKTVADNISNVINVSNNMDDINEVAAVDLSEIAADLDQFNNVYYGPLASEPTTRNDGTPSQFGDLYYNSIAQNMFTYTASGWVPTGAVSNDVYTHTVTAGEASSGTITLDAPYIVGSNNLVVFVNTTYQSILGNYTEVDSTTISFGANVLDEGDLITYIIGTIVSTINPTISVTKGTVTLSSPSTVVTLPAGVTYVPNTGNLQLTVDGQVNYVTTNFTESAANTVTFTETLPIGTIIGYTIGNYISNIPGTNQTGSFTSTASSNTTVVNDGRITASSVVILFPTNGFGAAIQANSGLYVDPANHVASTSFTVSSQGSNFTGSETFNYLIIG